MLRHDSEASHTRLDGLEDLLLRVELRKRLGTCTGRSVNGVFHSKRIDQVDYGCGDARTFILLALEVNSLAGFRAGWWLDEFDPSFFASRRCCLYILDQAQK